MRSSIRIPRPNSSTTSDVLLIGGLVSLTVGGFLIGVVAGFLALGIAALFLAYTIAPATPSREE